MPAQLLPFAEPIDHTVFTDMQRLPKLNVLSNNQGLVGGDKPRPYKCASIQWVGAQFIPARTGRVDVPAFLIGIAQFGTC